MKASMATCFPHHGVDDNQVDKSRRHPKRTRLRNQIDGCSVVHTYIRTVLVLSAGCPGADPPSSLNHSQLRDRIFAVIILGTWAMRFIRERLPVSWLRSKAIDGNGISARRRLLWAHYPQSSIPTSCQQSELQQVSNTQAVHPIVAVPKVLRLRPWSLGEFKPWDVFKT